MKLFLQKTIEKKWLAISLLTVVSLCMHGMERQGTEKGKLIPSLFEQIDGGSPKLEHRTSSKSPEPCDYSFEHKDGENRGAVVDIAEDLELSPLGEQDDEAMRISTILNSLPADIRTDMQNRMRVLSVITVQNQGAVRSTGKKKTRKTALLAHVLGEGLKVQIERNQLMAAASSNSSKIAKMGAFIAACTLITNIVNVWLSHPGNK